MRLVAASLLLVLQVTIASASSPGGPEGTNCRLAKPPDVAGEEMNHGVTLKIFPRARDIGSDYSGCQVLWAPNGNKWQVITITEVVRGDPVRLWSPHATPAENACRYRNGAVVAGDPDKCQPHPGYLLKRSMAPGCVEKIKTFVAKNGLGASRPEGCEYE